MKKKRAISFTAVLLFTVSSILLFPSTFVSAQEEGKTGYWEFVEAYDEHSESLTVEHYGSKEVLSGSASSGFRNRHTITSDGYRLSGTNLEDRLHKGSCKGEFGEAVFSFNPLPDTTLNPGEELVITANVSCSTSGHHVGVSGQVMIDYRFSPESNDYTYFRTDDNQYVIRPVSVWQAEGKRSGGHGDLIGDYSGDFSTTIPKGSNSRSELYIKFNINCYSSYICTFYHYRWVDTTPVTQKQEEINNDSGQTIYVTEADKNEVNSGEMTESDPHTSKTEGLKPIIQTIFHDADSDSGEDQGTGMIDAIILGIGGALAAAGALGTSHVAKKDGGDEDEKNQMSYKMYVRKDFGDTLDKLHKQIVYARIAKVTESGLEQPCNDLTAGIEIYAGENVVVTPLGMREGGYMAAEVIAAEESTEKEGSVCFRYEGKGGTFTEIVTFKLANPQIVFGQENLGLPAHYEKVSEVWFGVTGMVDPEIKAAFDGKKCPYCVEIVRDNQTEGLYCAKITDKDRTDKGKPGDTKTYHLRITATKEKERAESVFDISRVFMGLSLKLEANALGCYLKTRDGAPLNETRDDLVPCVTKGRLSLLHWNDEDQCIEKISICPKKNVTVKAYKVENDINTTVGEPMEAHQRMAEKLGICIFPMNRIDTDGSRIVELTCTLAGLDPPTRIRAEITVSATYQEETFETSAKVLLHSLPFRKTDDIYAYNEMLKQDEILCEKLTSIKSQIYSRYMNNLFSLYYFIDRMIDGYDPNFGYDQTQVNRVYSIWIRFVRGQFAGANAEAEKVTLADELNACYAFLQGMRDNGGFLGRMALGICTAGYSETLFFAMDLAEKMEDTIVRQGKDMTFWDGVIMGVKEYEKQVATELLMSGGLKLANYGGGKMLGKLTGHPEGIDIGKTITENYRRIMDSCDKALKKKSGTYSRVSDSLEKIGIFTSSGASAAKDVRDQSAKANAAAEAEVKTTIAQRRMGDLGKTPEQLKKMMIDDAADAAGLKKVKEFYDLMMQHGTARKKGELAKIEKKLEEAWLKVKMDKNAFKVLKRMQDPYAQTVKAEFSKIRKSHRQSILDNVLDDVAQKTGKKREDLYFESVTSNEAWKEDAGLSLPEDLDLTIRERCKSQASMDLDPVINQTIGEEAVAMATYKEFNGGKEPPSMKVAKEFATDMDVTYVSPWGDQGYVIEPNMEAFREVSKLLNTAHHGDPLRAQALERLTIAHKGKEWNKRGKACDARATELEADAATLTGAERDAKFKEATELRYKAHGCYVEGIRQITKCSHNIVEPRADMHTIINGGTNPFTQTAREMRAAGDMVQNGLQPSEFFDFLKTKYGTDFDGFADVISNCLM